MKKKKNNNYSNEKKTRFFFAYIYIYLYVKIKSISIRDTHLELICFTTVSTNFVTIDETKLLIILFIVV